MIPSIHDPTILLLTMSNYALIQSIGKKDIEAFCCYYLVIQNCTGNIGEKLSSDLYPVR